MKTVFITMFLLMSISTFAQTFFISDSITTKNEQKFYALYRNLESPQKEFDYITLKIRVGATADSFAVKTSNSDNSSYSYVGVAPQLTGVLQATITGGTALIWQGFYLPTAPRASWISIQNRDSTLSGTAYFTIEAK